MEDKSSEKSKNDNVVFAVPKLPKSARRNEVVPVGPEIMSMKKEPRKVLPEEQYVENMKTIIQRDYFPDIKKIRVCSLVKLLFLFLYGYTNKCIFLFI